LCLRNVHFFLGHRELSHGDLHLGLADTFLILVEYQKREERNETATQHRAGDPLLCPVIMWATTVKRVRSYPGTTYDTEAKTLQFKDKAKKIQGSKSHAHLWTALIVIVKDKLGFGPEDVGLHLICKCAAMAMYHGAVPVFTIMSIGFCSSNAFLHYIRRQVQ
jgi:hypothetical protein